MVESAPLPPPAARGGLEEGGRTLTVLLASIGAHVAFAAVLAVLPGSSSRLAAAMPVEIEMSFPMEAPIEEAPIEEAPIEETAPVPEPEVVPEPEPVARAERPEPRREPTAPEPVAPEPVAPEPAPAPAAMAPPSLDDVFGDPAPPLETMGAEGGGFAMAAGSPGGRAGGVPGGTGTGIGAAGVGAGGPAVATGPSTADIRRARRAYADQVRALLARHAANDYPVAARAQRLGGRIELALRIGEDGRLIAARVASSCGYAMLDEAAIDTANGIGSFPRPPTLVPWNPREEITIPVVYRVAR